MKVLTFIVLMMGIACIIILGACLYMALTFYPTVKECWDIYSFQMITYCVLEVFSILAVVYCIFILTRG